MISRKEIFEKMVERAAPIFGKKPEELAEDLAFVDDLGAKSVHYSQITTYLEDAFEVEIPYMTFRRQKTLGEAAEYVKGLLENE